MKVAWVYYVFVEVGVLDALEKDTTHSNTKVLTVVRRALHNLPQNFILDFLKDYSVDFTEVCPLVEDVSQNRPDVGLIQEELNLKVNAIAGEKGKVTNIVSIQQR